MNRVEAFTHYFKTGELYLWEINGEYKINCCTGMSCDECYFGNKRNFDCCPCGGTKEQEDKITQEVKELLPEYFL